MRFRRSILRDQLHVFGLVGIAVAYPVYSFLLANPAYLVANRITSGYLYLIIVLSSFLLPAVLAVIGFTLFGLLRKLYPVFHCLVIWGLVSLIFLPLLSQGDYLSVWLVFGLSAFFSVLVTREYHSNMFTYTGLLILVPLALGLPVHFALDKNINQVLNPREAQAFTWNVDESADLPPIIMIVYDELPLVHLLDAEGVIDESRFPAFAALAQEGTWYLNATTVHDQTIKAVPAILSGQYPVPGRVLPVSENYPRSLFAVLRRQYEVHAVESLTALSREGDEGFMLQPVDVRTVATDMVVFYLRSLIPQTAADAWLPLENGIWGGFLTQANLREWLQNNAGWRKGDRALNKRFDMSREFIENIASYPRSTFHYFHIALPHRPYGFLPSGRQYEYPIREDKFNVPNMTQEELDQGRAAHILQLGLADTILGMFRDKLLELGYWEDTLLVVVADHGQGYRPGMNNRLVTEESFGNVAFVPLLIKYPDQEAGGTDETNVQTIDIAPTVLDVLDVVDPPTMDGRSLLDKGANVPAVKMVRSESGSEYKLDRAAYEQALVNAHRESVDFFSLSDSRSDLFNYGQGLEHLGKTASELEAFRVDAEVVMGDPEKYRSVDLQGRYLPVFVRGEVIDPTDVDLRKTVVVILVNGVVRGITTPYTTSDNRVVFNKILPENALQVSNRVEALLLTGS